MIDQLKFATKTAQFFVKQIIKPGDIVIDATCGNGKDTLFLSNCVGPKGKVYAIDIQDQAIKNTRKLLEIKGQLDNVIIIKDNHNKLNQIIPETDHNKVTAIMFNLGYLPDSDHQILTEGESTLEAVKQSISLLASPGIITICLYPHNSGRKEAKLLLTQMSKLTGNLNAYEFKRINRKNPPYLLIITKDE